MIDAPRSLGVCIVFGGEDSTRYVLTPSVAESARNAIKAAIKNGLPEEARRADVICHLLDEMKQWTKTQRLDL